MRTEVFLRDPRTKPLDLTPLAIKGHMKWLDAKNSKAQRRLSRLGNVVMVAFVVLATLYFVGHFIWWGMKGFRVYGL